MRTTKATTMTKKGSFWSIFMQADRVDKFLMTIGFLGAFGDGISMSALFIVSSKVMNNIGNLDTSSSQSFSLSINKVSFLFLSVFHREPFIIRFNISLFLVWDWTKFLLKY